MRAIDGDAYRSALRAQSRAGTGGEQIWRGCGGSARGEWPTQAQSLWVHGEMTSVQHRSYTGTDCFSQHICVLSNQYSKLNILKI